MQPDRYSRIVRAVCEHPWAILPSALDALLEVIELRVAGVELSDEEVEARVAAGRRPAETVASAPGSVAVLPLSGVIAHRMSAFEKISGGTSTERFGADLAAAVNDPNVGAVVIDINSPGGSVYGVEELGDQIYAARERKPVVAVANSMAASAAYWLGSQASELVVTPSGDVGSIGVIAAHQDLTAAAEREGVRTTIFRAGRFKGETNPFEPLSDEARAELQGRVDAFYSKFLGAVARGRGTSEETVRQSFGEGRLVMAAPAAARGMVDRVATLQDTINRLSARLAKNAGAGARAEEGDGGAAAARARARLRLARAAGCRFGQNRTRDPLS